MGSILSKIRDREREAEELRERMYNESDLHEKERLYEGLLALYPEDPLGLIRGSNIEMPADQEKKDTNPKDAIGVRKVPMSVLSGPVMMEAALGMLEGARKYGRHNYRTIGVRASVYFDAVDRHIWDWWEGTDIDPDSGLNHISKAISSLMVLRDSMICGNWVDDRPPKVPEGWIQEYNKKAAEILDKYPNPVPAYTHLNTQEKK